MSDQAHSTNDDDAPLAVNAASEPPRLGKNLAALGAGQLFTWTMTLAWTLVVPRLLGPEGTGLIATGLAVAGILQVILGTGTGVYVARELVRAPHRSARVVVAAMIVRLGLTPLFMAAIFVWAQLANYSTEGKLVLYLSGGATVLFLLTEPAQSFFQAIERMHYRAIGDAINKAAQGLLGIALTVAGFGAIGFAACWLVMSGVVLVLSLRWARRYVRLEFRTTVEDMRGIVKGSVAYWTAGLFYMIYLWIDTAILSVMTNPTVVGWYGVPTKLFQTLMFLPGLVGTAWLPRLVRAAERSGRDLHAEARTPVDWVLGVSVPIAAVIGVSAAPVINLVYGHAYANSVPVLIILGIGLVPMYVSTILGPVCVAANRVGRWTWLMVGATIVNPALNATLIPLTEHRLHNGAIGAAIALVMTEVAVSCGGVAIVGRNVFGVAALKRVACAGLASAGMALVVYATRGAGAVASLAAGGFTLLALAWLLGAVSRDERRQLYKWVGKAAARFRPLFTRLRRRRPEIPTAAPIQSPAWSAGRRMAGSALPVAASASVAASADAPEAIGETVVEELSV
jgi:O-antigen/teichoic acid export membrane protein